MRPPPIVAILAASALAGCVVPQGVETSSSWSSPGSPLQDWAERAVAGGGDHDHRDPAHHAGLTTPNFQVLGHDPLVTDHHGRSSGGYFCGEARETDGRRLAFVHSFFSDVAFVVADVTDPAAPVVIGEFVMPLTQIYDLAATPDASHVVLATSPLDEGPDVSERRRSALESGRGPFFRDACTGEERPVAVDAASDPVGNAPLDSGVVLVNVEDPTNPRIVDYKPLPYLGARSVFATDVDGTEVVLASVTNLVHHGSYFAFFTVADTPLGGAFVPESVYRPVRPETNPVTNGHVDGWIQTHPVTGDVIG